ncbi:hypothetical protein [Agaribacter flavus]|uniref:Uncharacterized protein n=1 Tax=Agaribacter flavus TaxID=1902781 RepID=A0ABV7FST8_9ALTE
MSDSALNELGFAEFVAKLISDTFGAILSSQVEQQEKISELNSLLALDDDSFLDLCFDDPELLAQLTEFLASIFPFDSDEKHGIFEGANYQAASDKKEEQPPIYEQLQLRLVEKEDYEGKKLTQKGVDRIRRIAMLEVANKQRQLLSGVLSNGIPKLLVDSGKINAKLTFNIPNQEGDDQRASASENSASTTTGSAASVFTSNTTVKTFSNNNFTLANRFAGVIDPKKLLKTRINIRPASNKAPQDTQSTANIYSEVEITFKTIL